MVKISPDSNESKYYAVRLELGKHGSCARYELACFVMGLLYDKLHSLDDAEWDGDFIEYDDDEELDYDNFDEETLEFLKSPVKLPESLLTEIGNISRRQQQEWEDRYRSSLKNSSRNLYREPSRESSREHMPDTGWTRNPSFIDRVGGPIKIERKGNHDEVLVFYPGQPMWGGQGWPMYTPDGTRATSAYWSGGVLYIQLNDGRMMRCWDPYNYIMV